MKRLTDALLLALPVTIDESEILVNTLGESAAGNINIVASESLELIGVSADGQFSSSLLARVGSGATGSGGEIMIETDRLTLRDGAQISTTTRGPGRAGNINVRSPLVEAIGFNNESGNARGLFANVDPEATVNGGNVGIETERLTVGNGGQIATVTFGTGNAGSLMVRSDEVILQGVGLMGRSGILASAIEGTGAGGNLTIHAEKLIISDGATVAASNFQSIDNRPPGKREFSVRSSEFGVGDLLNAIMGVSAIENPMINQGLSIRRTHVGQGPAGNIQIFAEDLQLERSGKITAAARTGDAAAQPLRDRGNISINSSQLFMGGASGITTDARGTARGGNIAIATDTLVARENSDISANAEGNFGGKVTITAQGIFGTANSDITATSQLGAEFNGIVEIKTSDVDPSAGLILLSEGVVDAEALIGQDPCLQGKDSEFIITGRGGLPPNPNQDIVNNTARVSWIEPVDGVGGGLPPNPNQDIITNNGSWIEPVDGVGEVEITNGQGTEDYALSRQIVPGRGWIFQADGSVLLVGYDPVGSLTQRVYNTTSICKQSRDSE